MRVCLFSQPSPFGESIQLESPDNAIGAWVNNPAPVVPSLENGSLTAFAPGIPVHTHTAYPNVINLHAAGIGHNGYSTPSNQNASLDYNYYPTAASAGIEGPYGTYLLNQSNGIRDFTSPPADFPGFRNLDNHNAVPDPTGIIDPTLMTVAPPRVNNNSHSRRTRLVTGRFACHIPGCGATCTREADLGRHKMTKHRLPQYDCPFPGCERKGARAFPRKDKLAEHQRKRHQTTN